MKYVSLILHLNMHKQEKNLLMNLQGQKTGQDASVRALKIQNIGVCIKMKRYAIVFLMKAIHRTCAMIAILYFHLMKLLCMHLLGTLLQKILSKECINKSLLLISINPENII